MSPLVFRRLYNTSYLQRPAGVLGRGWVHAFEASLERDLDGYRFEGHDGERLDFDDVDGRFADAGEGASIVNRGACMELRREGERLVVYHWHDVDEPVQKYVFNSRDGERMLLAARVLPSGQGLRIERDRLGRAVAVTQTKERRRLLFGYDEHGRLARLHLDMAAQPTQQARLVARYEYDDRSRLVAVYDAVGAARRYAYDEHDRMVAEAGHNGGVFRMRYDARGRCIESTGEGGYRKCTLRYDPGATTVTDSLGFETLYVFNAQGQVVHTTLASGAKSLTELDEHGRIIGEINPLGKATRYRYDDIGRIAEKTLPNGARFRYEYDPYHQPVRIIEPDGAIWRLRYERGALVEVKDPFDRRTLYSRGPANELIGVIASSGQELRIGSDESGDEVLADQFGVLRQRTLNVYRNSTETRDAQGLLSRSTYDGLGRLSRFERPDGSVRHFAYDPNGALTQLTDARGGAWRARYDPHGNCIERSDPLGRRHQFEWDSEGRLIGITNPKGETARYQYDCCGKVIAVQHFDGSREEATYDLASRLVGRVRRDGTRLQFERDDVGNLLTLSVLDSKQRAIPIRRFEYDVSGSPVEAWTPDADIRYEYQVGGRLTAEVQNGKRIEYAFDSRGYICQRGFQDSQAGPVTFEYDARGRIRRFSTANGEGQSYDYDLRDQCVERKLGLARAAFAPAAPLSEVRKYDLQGRLRHQSLGKLTARTYQYDAEGALTELRDQLRGQRQYEYDAADQLRSSVSVAPGPQLYDYDACGNLTAKSFERLDYGSGNRLESLSDRHGATRFERNANGELVRWSSADRDDHYTWDALGQLTRVRHRDGSETTFGYDALGRRVMKEHRQNGVEPGASQCTRYYWSGDDLLAERGDDLLTEYATWGFVPEALWENGRIRHVVTCRQGVPQELIDDRGRLVWRGTFDDWGKLIKEDGETSCRLRLPGQLFDAETGLHYNRFRYYSPDAAQFISPDPIGYGRSKNLFRFAPNAIGWTDALGLECWAHAAQEAGAQRRAATEGDADFPSREAALAEAARRHGVDPGTLEATPMYGNNPNLVGPKGQPWERVSGLDANANIVSFDHHANGHYFQDAGEYELPHYHGPNGEHLCYER